MRGEQEVKHQWRQHSGAPLAPPPFQDRNILASQATDAGVFAKVTVTTAAIVDVLHAKR